MSETPPETGQNDAGDANEAEGVASGVDDGKARDVAVMGRPTLYKAEFVDQAAKLCRLGATDMEMADFFGVDRATLYRWKARYPEFCDAIKTPGEVADDRVERRLYERAMGYEATEIDIRVINDRIVKTPVRKVYPPDTAAAFIWLKNRRRHQWRDRHDIQVGGTVSLVQLVAGTPDADV